MFPPRAPFSRSAHRQADGGLPAGKAGLRPPSACIEQREGRNHRLSDAELLHREYSTSERMELRRHNVSGWLCGDEAWEAALRAIAAKRPHRVLDAGCGDGLFASMVAAPVVVGIDNAPAMVERARSRGVDAHEHDLHALPFGDGEFDVAVCNWVFYHLADVDRAVAELARVVRPGGRLIGVYNRPGHMSELWSQVRPGWDAGDPEYADLLGQHFASVDHIDTEAYTLWVRAQDLQQFLDAYVEFFGALSAPAEPYPFQVTRLNRVYVAEG